MNTTSEIKALYRAEPQRKRWAHYERQLVNNARKLSCAERHSLMIIAERMALARIRARMRARRRA